jgi:hypothetical protein
MSDQRAAQRGERCTCGRQASTVFFREDGTEIGYCGLPDGGDRTGVPLLRPRPPPPLLGRPSTMPAIPSPA